MATIDVSLENVSSVTRLFRRLPSAVQRSVVRKSLRSAANLARDRLRAAAPVDTGRLRRSIRTSVRVDSRKAEALVYVLADARYWLVLEYGDHDTPPRPFAAPALAGIEDEIFAEFRRRFDRLVDEEARRF